MYSSTLQNLLRPDFEWGDLFEPFVYEKTYPRFLKIYLSACEKDDLVDWVGWVKSRFRSLVLKVSSYNIWNTYAVASLGSSLLRYRLDMAEWGLWPLSSSKHKSWVFLGHALHIFLNLTVTGCFSVNCFKFLWHLGVFQLDDPSRSWDPHFLLILV